MRSQPKRRTMQILSKQEPKHGIRRGRVTLTNEPKGSSVGVAVDFSSNPRLLQTFLDKLGALTHLHPEIIKWYYTGDNVIDVTCNDIDDRISVVHITSLADDIIRTKSITIGTSDKKQIYTSFLLHNPHLVQYL